MSEKCVWKVLNDYNGNGFITDCRMRVHESNYCSKFEYCPYCGKEIEVKGEGE
jgi:hypothetical protein